MIQQAAFNSHGRKISRASGLERHRQIILATLRLIIREGMRGVRHRAIAQEAEVPLAATTYYFKTLEDLISEAFTYWADASACHTIKFREQCLSVLDKYSRNGHVIDSERATLAEEISNLTVNHIIDQVTEQFNDRILELAFYHEANNNPQLRDVVLALEQSFLDDLTAFIEVIGSPQPRVDAQITLSLIQRMEQLSVMRGRGRHDVDEIRRVIHRHVFQLIVLE